MRLYHFCRPKDLDSIAEKGLYPHVAYDPRMSVGQSAVWLTAAETTEATPRDFEHFQKMDYPRSCSKKAHLNLDDRSK
jgi:hypothetical protein